MNGKSWHWNLDLVTKRLSVAYGKDQHVWAIVTYAEASVFWCFWFPLSSGTAGLDILGSPRAVLAGLVLAARTRANKSWACYLFWKACMQIVKISGAELPSFDGVEFYLSIEAVCQCWLPSVNFLHTAVLHDLLWTIAYCHTAVKQSRPQLQNGFPSGALHVAPRRSARSRQVCNEMMPRLQRCFMMKKVLMSLKQCHKPTIPQPSPCL